MKLNIKLKMLKKLILLLSLVLPLTTFGAVAKLEFTTSPRAVAPSTLSEVLTVQTQDEAGAEFKIEETGDLAFTSTSATGEFLNASGEPVSMVMSRNSANRNFYYRDSTVGAPTITVMLTARTSGTSWTATQAIMVGTVTTPPPDDDSGSTTPTNNQSTDTSSSSSNSGSGGTLSVHSSQTPLSQVAPTLPFKVGAGRPRLGTIHTPLAFAAEGGAAELSGARFDWSFSDGASARGADATHTYKLPGEYIVILNAMNEKGEKAVARTSVSISAPALSLGAVTSDRITLINQSPREVNLGGWRVSQGNINFIFPDDTIIAANRELTIPATTLGFLPAADLTLNLNFPDGAMALNSDLAILTRKLTALKQQLAAATAARVPPPARVTTPLAPVVERPQATIEVSQVAQVAAVGPPAGGSPASVAVSPNQVMVVPKSQGLLTRLKQWLTD